MKTIAKSLVLYPSTKKWSIYQQDFYQFYIERDLGFDALISFYRDFQAKYGEFPTAKIINQEAAAANDMVLSGYLEGILGDREAIAIEADADFISHLRTTKAMMHQLNLSAAMRQAAETIAQFENTSPEELDTLVSELLAKASHIRSKGMVTVKDSSYVMHGDAGKHDLAKIYARNVQARRENRKIFYSLPLPGLEEIDIKRGDLLFTCAFTSQGKSIILRLLTYYFATIYGMNWVFFSFEMSADVMRVLFAIIHANNQEKFPGAPRIKYDHFKKGILTDEQIDFLFNVAEDDLLNNPDYGTIVIEQPQESKYTVPLYVEKLQEIEREVMPIDGVSLDYATMMWPVEGKGTPDRSAYNGMIKQLKNSALTHRNTESRLSPLVLFTAAQISRGGFEECIKNDGVYSLAAIGEFSEIEKSSDVVLTSLMTNEMKAAGEIHIQNLKNRDGAVILDPVALNIDLEHGQSLVKIKIENAEDLQDRLQSLTI